MNPLFLIGGVLLIWSFINQGRAAYNQLQYAVDRINRVNFGLFSSSIDFTFSITNNTNVAATVQSVDGVIIAEGRQLGTFVTKNLINITPGGTTKVQARANITSLEFARNIFTIIRSGKTPEIQFDGAITTQLLGRIPFKYTAFLQGDLSLKKS